MKYLKFYKKCVKTGKIPKNGLCECLPQKSIDLISPSSEDLVILEEEELLTGYWGSGLRYYNLPHDKAYKFTPLRQTLVLLLAAINNEL